MPDNRVRPNSRKLTGEDVRDLISDALVIGDCHALGPSRVAALAGGVDEKTIRRARDRETTLGTATTFNLLDADEHILDTLAAAKGFMLVPLIARGATDIIPSAGAAIHTIGSNRAENSDGGAVETDRELVNSEAQNDALLLSVLERRARIVEAKLRLAQARAA